MEASTIARIKESMKLCASTSEDKCDKCQYRYRVTRRNCYENLMRDVSTLVEEQQKLIAKFGKMFME